MSTWYTVYPKKYAHGFVVLCFVVVMQSFIMNSYEVFIHIHQGCFAGTGAIVRLPQCQWSKPDGYGKISQYITTTKHSKAKTVCIFLGIYCTNYIRAYLDTLLNRTRVDAHPDEIAKLVLSLARPQTSIHFNGDLSPIKYVETLFQWITFEIWAFSFQMTILYKNCFRSCLRWGKIISCESNRQAWLMVL